MTLSLGFKLVDFDTALGRADEAGMRLAHALGLAGGAGGVEDDGDILCLDGVGHGFPCAGVVAVPCLAQLLELFGADEPRLGVFAQATRIVVDDVLNAGHGFAHFQQLVDLLLVFGKRKGDVCVLHHKTHLLCDRVLVQRNRHGAYALDGDEAHVQVGAVVADKGQILALCRPSGPGRKPYGARLGRPLRQKSRFARCRIPSRAEPQGIGLSAACFSSRCGNVVAISVGVPLKFHSTRSERTSGQRARQVHELNSS